MRRNQFDDFIAAWRSLMDDADSDGYSPLMAVKEGYVEAIFHLVDLGTDVNLSDDSGFTPLRRAVEESNVQLVQISILLIRMAIHLQL
jgi:ankyrin repeat protein